MTVVTADQRRIDQLWIELTQECNLRCSHCCIRASATAPKPRTEVEQPTHFFVDLLTQAHALGCHRVHFTGGEVLVRRSFGEVYRHASRLGFQVCVTTNATLVDAEMAQFLATTRPAALKVSFYGWDQASYEETVGVAGSFARFRSGVAHLVGRGLAVWPLLPPVPRLLEHKEDVRSLAVSLGVHARFPREWDLTLHARRVLDATQRLRALRYDPEQAARQRMANPRLVLGDLRVIMEARKHKVGSSDRAFFCSAGTRNLGVTAQGLLQPCRPLRDPAVLFDLTRGSLHKAITEHLPMIRERRVTNADYIERCLKCVLRPACPSCAASSWMEHGNLDAPTEYYCQIMHIEAYWLRLLPRGAKGWQAQESDR